MKGECHIEKKTFYMVAVLILSIFVRPYAVTCSYHGEHSRTICLSYPYGYLLLASLKQLVNRSTIFF